MATLPIYLEVEDTAVGPVLIALKKMPGIIKMHLALLDEKPVPAARPDGMNSEQTIVALFAKRNGGPIQLSEIQAEIGGPKSRAYGALYALKKKGVLLNTGKGEYKFSAKAMHMMQGAAPSGSGAALALPKPPSHHAKSSGRDKPAKTKTGRAPQGTGSAALRALLTEKGPLKPGDIKTVLSAKGVSQNSTSGVLERARRDGLIKKLPSGDYDLTAKGKLSTPQETQQAGA